MPRFCDHEFYSLLSDTDKDKKVFGIIVCAFCGQVRHLYADGRVIIAINEGQIIKQNATSDTNNKSEHNN